MRGALLLRIARGTLLSCAGLLLQGARLGPDFGVVISQAHAQEWRPVPTAAGPAIRRQEGLIVDEVGDRLVVAGGEHSDARTWALDLSQPQSWIDLGAPIPTEVIDVTRAIYDAADRKMILVGPQMTVYALDLAHPGGWTTLIASGTGPVPRTYPAVAYDSRRNQLVVFGGGPGTGTFADVWTLNLSGTPTWQRLSPSAGPSARWAAVGIYDPIGDRFVVATGNDGASKSDVWALSLASPTHWDQLLPSGERPVARYLSAGAYARGSGELVIFGGNTGSGGLNDVWSLNLSQPTAWHKHVFSAPTPPPRWSHMMVYRPAQSEMVTYGGWDGSNYRSDVWALPQVPETGPPSVASFSPLGGKIGDEVTISGIRLDSPTQVTIGGSVAAVVSSSRTAIHAIVPAGAVTGPITVTNAFGTGTSGRDYFVGELPTIDSFSPDSARAGDAVVILGQHLGTTLKVSFGGKGSATIGTVTDTEVHVLVDTLGVPGPIQLSTLVGTTNSSSTFLVIADDPRPRLLSVRDVRNDQGGKVLLRWRASDFDQQHYRVITGYRVWRRAPLTDLKGSYGASTPRPVGSIPDASAPGVLWESIARLPASFLQGYAFAAPTLIDSSEAGNPYTAYFVQAITADPFVFYNSSPDSGYSVDNLSPPAPSPLTVRYGPAENAMHWHASGAADLRGYELYRGTSSTFLPSPATRIATTAETSYTDAPGSHYYKLAAIDLHGNRSRFVAVAPDVPVGTLAAFVHSDRTPGRVQLTWYSGGNAGMQAHVQRRTDLAEWSTLGTITVDGSGFLRFEDASAEDGLRYAYRLAILDGEGVEDTFTSESWIEPLAAARLSLAIAANPSVGGRILLGLTLPASAQASVSLFDLAGREVERQVVSPGGNGRADVTLGSGSHLRPGLYMIRATSGDVTVTRRVAVIL